MFQQILKRSRGKDSNGPDNSTDSTINEERQEPHENDTLYDAEMLAEDPENGALNGQNAPEKGQIPNISHEIEAVEEKLRDALNEKQHVISQNKQMEDALRLMARKMNITGKDIEQMDIMEISAKMVQFVRGDGIPPVESVDTEAADSLLIEEVFDEIDDHERKYEEEDRGNMETAQTVKADDDAPEYEDDVPPKKVW